MRDRVGVGAAARTPRIIPALLAGLFVGAAAAVVVIDRLLRLNLDEPSVHLVAELALTVVGTFVGAAAAFALQTYRDGVKERATRAAALRRAQFALVAQWNALEGFRRELDPLRGDPDRDLKLLALVYYHEIPAIDLASLAFLLETRDPDLVSVLLHCQNQWNTTVGVLAQRSREHRRFLERLEAVRGNEAAGTQVSSDQVRADVGPEIGGALRSLTNGLYEAVDAARAANDASWERLEKQFTAQFPSERVLKRALNRDTAAPCQGEPPTQIPPASPPGQRAT